MSSPVPLGSATAPPLASPSLITTLRSYKIPGTGGMVVFDWAVTLLAAYLIPGSFICNLVILLLASVLLHLLFNVPTVTNYYLGLSVEPERPT